MRRVRSAISSVAHLTMDESRAGDTPHQEALCGWEPQWPYRWEDGVPPDGMYMCRKCDMQYRQGIAEEIGAGQ